MNIISRYIGLCLFKVGPADVPASNSLLQLTLLTYFFMALAINQVDHAWDMSLMKSITEILFMMITVGLLVRFRGFQARYQQTLTALAGVGCCFGLVGSPVILILNQTVDGEQTANLSVLFWSGFMIWSLMVTSHIFRQALEIKAGTATVIAAIYTILYLVLSVVYASLFLRALTTFGVS